MRALHRIEIITVATLLASTLPLSAASSQPIVAAGFDLLNTTNADFDFGGGNLVDFRGVDLGTFVFPDPHGEHDVGNTDTIVQRDETAVRGADGTSGRIDIHLAALSLVSHTVVPVFGEQVFTEVLADNGSWMNIDFDDMLFESHLAFDLGFVGATSGATLFTAPVELTLDWTPWSRDPPPGAVLIPGVNYLLNGMDNSWDFFPDPATHYHDGGSGTRHETAVAMIPEPGTFLLVAMGSVLGLGGRLARSRRSRRRSAPDDA